MNTTANGGPARAPYRWARIALVIAGLALAGSGLSGVPTPAGAAGPVDDGSDWGAQGELSSDSPVTVRWDNAGNPATSNVPRNGQQLIPHTKDPETGTQRSYDDIKSTVVDAYTDYFSDLSVSVSQTRDLVNQSVTVDIHGSKGDRVSSGTVASMASFQVFQCWGGLTDTGAPDPNAANPDPATCQFGAGGPDGRDGESREQRRVFEDTLVLGSDWDDVYRNQGFAPFVAVNGRKVDGQEGKNPLFDRNMTNELSNISVSESGAAQRQFEVQTTVESYGLGCGKRSDAPSTRSCWLVVVPRIKDVLQQAGPISPSVWAQRLQVKLDFRNISTGCPGGRARSLIGGSEMLTNAAESWVPGVCAGRDIALGYSQLADPVGRAQFETGANGAILSSVSPATPAVPVPLALVGPAIAFQLTYQPSCGDHRVVTEDEAKSCGYVDLAALEADHQKTGTPVRDVKLDARLVAKLLTQSYYRSMLDKVDRAPLPDWGKISHRPAFLTADPEFKRLNPHLRHLQSNIGEQMDHLIVEGMRSDAATRVWQWIMADPDARAFVNGCPDADGVTVNPFYSTRTYVGCENQKDALTAKADADRAATSTPTTYVDSVLSYPPSGSPYPLPTWQEYPAREGESAYTLIDKLPRVESMPAAGREVGRGHVPKNSEVFCRTADDDTCQPEPGKYKAEKARQSPSSLNLMAITDTATAARWRVPTAALCSSSGDKCVGADVSSLRKAADRFEKDAVGWYTPGADDLASGAYPLTLPVYAAIDPDLPLADRKVYADALDFITTKGQVPGFEAGELPPGYAPLTNAMRDQAKAGIAELRKAVPVVVVPPVPGNTGAGAGTPDAVIPPAVAPVTDPAAVAPVAPPTVTDEIMAVSASTETWDWWTIPFGVGIALIAGLGGPIMRLRGRFVVGR